jgi:hypothetical protein
MAVVLCTCVLRLPAGLAAVTGPDEASGLVLSDISKRPKAVGSTDPGGGFSVQTDAYRPPFRMVQGALVDRLVVG